MQIYEMKPGDTLETVAKQFGISLEELFELNRATYGPYPTMERPGVSILIPDNNNDSSGIEQQQQ